jgi:TRAP-type C4-dicarboxylate transport system permease small subunit
MRVGARPLVPMRRGAFPRGSDMTPRLARVCAGLDRFANIVAALLMATMFVSFLLQITFRYVFDAPLGWTEEVTVLCWVWVVLWGAGFVLKDADEIRFDVIYAIVGPRVQRAFRAVYSIAFIVLLAVSLPAAWSYVTFMKREHTAYLRMPFDILYSIYILFVVAQIVRHALIAWQALSPPPPASAAAEPR